jgi:GTP-binding protein Era
VSDADQNETGNSTASKSIEVAGTIAILGRPNVGKSTLLNALVGEKLAIVTPKPQTTRNRIVGVWNGVSKLPEGDPRGPGREAKGQIVFVDTPGVHAARSKLNRFMVREAMGTIEDVDAVLLVVEAKEHGGKLPSKAALPEAERWILERLQAANKPAVLCLNKVDHVKDKGELFPLIEWWGGAAPFSAIVPTTATRKKGLDGLIREILRHMPEQAPLYGPDVLTDRTERFIASEYIREQLFLRLREELPYSTAVVIDRWEDRERGDVMIDATIVVERESQKAIVVGKKGEMIRDVGTDARKELSTFLDRPAHLRLYVKVQEGWSSTEAGLADMGYSEDEK